MSNLRNLTNDFHDVRLASLATWKQASRITPCDRGGPYVVMQEGCDPQDAKVRQGDFVLGRSGKWIALRDFYGTPVPERVAEYVFGTAAEVMRVMGNLSSKVEVVHPEAAAQSPPAAPETDEMAAAIQAGKAQSPGATG